MKSSCWMVVIILLLLPGAGCISHNRNSDISVTSLDPDEFAQDMVGDYEVYTGSFQITNPTNTTFDNIDVEISLTPTATYCHGNTQSFTIPRLLPLERRTVQLSAAEFANLNCLYNYSYLVSSTSGNVRFP